MSTPDRSEGWERDAYLYARHRFQSDAEAAGFVEWMRQHPSVDLHTGFQAWRDEIESFDSWEQELHDA